MPELMTLATHTPARALTPPVFLHSGWRSSGTWIWARFRALPDVAAFCEPLHEALARMTPASLAEFRSDSWESRHPATEPYFQEFAPLLQRRHGVKRFRIRFSFESFFMDAQARDSALASYLQELQDFAWETGRLPVFKFARSHGRVAWMRQMFPHAVHAAVVRNPLAQWASSYAFMRSGTPYFLAAPLAILAHSRDNRLVDPLVEALAPHIRLLRGFTFDRTYKRCAAFVATAPAEALYRSFLAYWLATGVAALPHVDLTIDADALADDPSYGRRLSETLQNLIGRDISFEHSSARPARIAPDLTPREIEAADDDAARACKLLLGHAPSSAMQRAAETLIAKLLAR